MLYRTPQTHGYLLILVLVFGSIFLATITAFSGFIITQKKHSETRVYREQALAIAEAGLDYYKWYLAHFPGDITNGTGQAGPYVHSYNDPEGGTLGEFSLGVSGNTVCGDVTSIDIHATGTVAVAPEYSRTVYARYARPTVSEFAYIINSNVWAGSDRTIIGPYHSNGGVRMDGTNNSTVSSGVETWLCTGSFGCSPNQTVSGVFGAGPNADLWQYPAPPINFTGLTVDLSDMKAKAQASGLYFAPSDHYGYHVIFYANNTIDVYRVNSGMNMRGYTSENGWQYERNVITGESFLGNYAIPDCGIIFAEDKLWIEGVVGKKVTIAAANLITPGVDPSIILSGDITYGDSDGTDGLLAVAEDSVLISLESPNNMTLEGIFVAQNGRFGRNHYTDSYTPAWLRPYIKQDTLTIRGSIVSNLRVGTKWTSNGNFVSGYNTRYNSYDRNLVSDPPPLTPYTSDTYKFIEWREEN